MDDKYLDNSDYFRTNFISSFVLSWEDFQTKYADWINEMNKINYTIDKQWYNQSSMWERMDPKYLNVSLEKAIELLSKCSGEVLYMTDVDEQEKKGKKKQDYVAQEDARKLAERIGYEWYLSYELTDQYVYIPNALPEDLYVFDTSMDWCIVFTHETTDWDAEKEDDMAMVARSRLCIYCGPDDCLIEGKL